MINVHKLELRNVTCHKCFVLDLPARGIVLITGPNGSGKSTIVESVAVAGWGEFLRGKSCWTDEPGQVVMQATVGRTELRIDRRRTGGKNSLQFASEDTDRTTYDTASKAQEVLDEWVGSFDVWRRSCAFSSRDSSHFTEAGDAERKRFLEIILGLDALDAASTLVRQDVRGIEKQATDIAQRAELVEQKVALLSQQLREDQQALATLAPPNVSVVDPAELQKRRTKLRAEIEAVEEPLGALQQQLGKAAGVIEKAKADSVRINAYSQCPTCGQRVSQGHKHNAVVNAADLEQEFQAELKDLADQKSQFGKVLKGLRLDLEKIGERIACNQADLTLVANYEHAKKHLADRVTARRDTLAELVDTQDDLSTEVHDVLSKLATLEVVDKVLSTRGLRAHLLHNALAFVEQTANLWLARIAGPGLRLHLTPYAAKSDGSTKDVIGLEVEGAGGGNGYKGASGGERRRIDIALMLALSEVARTTAGVPPGTLFLDECLDALDAEGVSAVCEVMDELAEDHCLVIISHNEDVVRGLHNVHEHVRLEHPT